MPAQSHAYLTVYEMEGDVDATMGKIREAVMSGAMSMGDSLDLASTVMSYWTPRGPKVIK
jgi:hypothetical protein